VPVAGERETVRMVDREAADAVLQRIALSALLYYPQIGLDDPSYRVEDQVEWCLAPLDPAARDAVRELAEDTIRDPTGYRAELFTRLMELTTPDT
jgi:hypothetical protein